MWDGRLYIQLRDGRFVPYLEWIEARRRDSLEEMRWLPYVDPIDGYGMANGRPTRVDNPTSRQNPSIA